MNYMLDTNIQQQEQLKVQVAKSNHHTVKILINCVRYLSPGNLAFQEHTEEGSNYFQLVYLMSK